MTAELAPAGLSDRASAARLLVGVAHDLFDTPAPVAPIRIGCREEPVDGDVEEFLRTRLADCPSWLITRATRRISWTDSDGVSNVAYAGSLGAVVPIVAREATLALCRMLDADPRVGERTDALSPADRALVERVTTDHDPLAVLRTGIDAAARVLVQHAYLAERTPYDDPAAFAAVLRDSGIFTTVAGTWHWGLQASTYRRGLIPVQLISFGGRVTYSADTVAALRAMKEARVAGAADGTDPSATQYAALEGGEQPRCLAHAPQVVDGRRFTLVTRVADLFVETFTRLLDVVEIEPAAPQTPDDGSASAFEVPDMTCQHCVRTITKAVAEFGVEPPEFDLVSKRVTAVFASAEIRELSFTAIRARGYTVVPLPD
ncbi:heavy-metal-associated domain-containing protein [Kribbella sp. NPDC004875]|uniref:heavy-metal-associated domain-containing protein n=1 Tax=Kribbella sp. NPDC004875 TaxID=3364107 RepID=UPI0036BCD8AE